jgi:hypothetical protein
VFVPALQAGISNRHETQGVALGYVIPAFQAEAFKRHRRENINTVIEPVAGLQRDEKNKLMDGRISTEHSQLSTIYHGLGDGGGAGICSGGGSG